jgi:hypothetical protein
MSRSFALGAAGAVAVTVGALAVSAASATSAAVPGPRQPVEHLSISGANFDVRSGNPGCYTGGGSVGANFAVPRGAMVTGATLYVIDNVSPGSIFGELDRHQFSNGGSYRLGYGKSTVDGTSTVDIVVDPGYVLAPAEAVNLIVSIPDGTCFKGAEVHFIRDPSPTAGAAMPTRRAAPTTALTPAAGP